VNLPSKNPEPRAQSPLNGLGLLEPKIRRKIVSETRTLGDSPFLP
jgi:hypothetical protein